MWEPEIDEETRVAVGEAFGMAGDTRLEDEAALSVFIRGGKF